MISFPGVSLQNSTASALNEKCDLERSSLIGTEVV